MLHRRFVENHLVAFEPERVLPVLAPNLRGMHENRAFVRMAPCTDFVISTLATLLIEATEARARFRVYDSIKSIRNIIRNSQSPQKLSEACTALLFRLYQHYIYSPKEEIQWCVSIYLKDRELSAPQVQWLISNASTSAHILNRLLRYPTPHRDITKWAKSAFVAKSHPDRMAELLGLQIKNKVPSFASQLPVDSKIWAIYYSRATEAAKSKMIIDAVTPEAADEALKVALRLRLPKVIHHLASIVAEDA